MTAIRRGDRLDSDAEAVSAAARQTAWRVVAVSAAIVVVILGLAVMFILNQSRPKELLERPAPGEQKIYVDAKDMLIALVALGLIAIVLVGLSSLAIARRAVTPLGTALRMQRSFVADASHELRTPLTVLDSRLQVLGRRLERGEPYVEALGSARADTRAMIDLVTDLLLVAESSSDELRHGVHGGSDIRAVVLGVVSDMRMLAEQRGIEVVADVQGEARLTINEVGLRRCLVVLLDNAIAHAPDGTTVSVATRLERGRVAIRVLDQGAGIRDLAPEQVFDRFAHAAGTAGVTQRRSFGLGLALVRDLAARNGGRVEVERTGPDGTTMRLELPVARG